MTCKPLQNFRKSDPALGYKAHINLPMFARTALRAATRPAPILSQRLTYATAGAATASTSSPQHFSASAVEGMNPHGLEISRAQRVSEDGLVSGKE